ncbi:MAG: hypothetical protein H7Z17_03845 [Fuerstia sp.]|nr:hypothetical protein [Fuerstiella sp.]
MATTSANLGQRVQIVSASENADATSARVPVRTMLGSGGTSIVIHLVVLLVLSLIMSAQQDTSAPLSTEVHFNELPGEREDVFVLSDAELLETETTPLNLPEITSLIAPDTGAAAETKIDLTAFASSDVNQSGSGVPSAVAAIASGIKGRVEKAGGRTGEVQFSLAWHTLNDVDLHVIAPSGEHISYSHRTSVCKGNLDVDMNASTTNDTDQTFSEEPVENVRWLDRTAPSGRFTVIVNQFEWRNGRTEDPYQLLVKLNDVTQLVEGEVNAQENVSVHRFHYIKSSFSKARREKLAAELTALQEREEVQASELFERARIIPTGRERDRMMLSVITKFPHTDASIRAMQELNPIDKN